MKSLYIQISFLIIAIFSINILPQPNIYIDPPNQLIYGQKTVSINVRIENAETIRAYSVKVNFNRAVLKLKSASKGNFLTNNGLNSTVFFKTPDADTNYFQCDEVILGFGYPPSGSGILFTAQFDIVSTGNSLLTFESITLFQPINILVKATNSPGIISVMGKILVVDDSPNQTDINDKYNTAETNSSASLFTSSLANEGYFVDQINFAYLNASNLNNYDVVILSAGLKETEIFNSLEKRAALVNYTLSGGKTLVEGGEVGYLFRKDGLVDIDQNFRRYLLMDSAWISNRFGSNLQIVNSNHPIFNIPNNISNPITIAINNGGITGVGARDEVTLLPHVGISRIANWSGGIFENGGIILFNPNGDTSISRNIFYTFSVSQIADQSLAAKLIVNSVRYLMKDFEEPIKMLNLKALVEGLYNGSTTTPDTMQIEFREGIFPFNLVELKHAAFDTLGRSNSFFYNLRNSVPYFLVLKHRNSIEVWSATVKNFSAGYLSYDFTTDAGKAFGNNLIKVGTKWCMHSGDVNQDGKIDSVDLSLISNNAFSYPNGFLNTDLNGDGFIDLSDLTICDNNAYRNIVVIKP